MACNRGIFELKYFFTASIASSDGGEAHSAEAVRHHIRQMIDAESPRDILSDDTIVDRLREIGNRDRAPHGCEISRGDAHSVIRAAPPRKAAFAEKRKQGGKFRRVISLAKDLTATTEI